MIHKMEVIVNQAMDNYVQAIMEWIVILQVGIIVQLATKLIW